MPKVAVRRPLDKPDLRDNFGSHWKPALVRIGAYAAEYAFTRPATGD